MGNMNGSYGSHYTLWQTITENSVNTANNTSNVTVRMYLNFDGSSYYAYTNYTTNGTMTINGNTHNYSVNPISFSSGQRKDELLATWTGDIGHNADGTKLLEVSGSWNTETSRIGAGNCSASINLTTIQGNPIFITNPRVISRTINSLTFNGGNLSMASDLYYSLDNSSWDYMTDMQMTISNLNPNTTYTIYVQARSQLDGNFKTTTSCTGTTYDIAKISNLSNFKHGDDVSVTITNPGNINNLNLVMMIESNQVLSRIVSSGVNILTFSDKELDSLYKKYGSDSSVIAKFSVSGSGYTNSKTSIITLNGNQKTIRSNIGNDWRRGKVWININGIWKRGIVWHNVDGIWRRCI